HAEGVGRHLGEARFVTLPRVHRARRDDDATLPVEPHRRALEGADRRALDVARDPDAAVDAPGAERRLLSTELGVTRRLERLPERLGKIARVVDQGVAVAIR